MLLRQQQMAEANRQAQQMLDLRALQQQQLDQWRQGQLAETERYHMGLLDQSAPLRSAQAESAKASATRYNAAAGLDAAKARQVLDILDASQRAGAAARERSFGPPAPLAPEVHDSWRDTNMADLVGAITQVAASSPQTAERMLAPFSADMNKNTINALGQLLFAGTPSGVRLGQGDVLVNPETGAQMATGLPPRPAAGRDLTSRVIQAYGHGTRAVADLSQIGATDDALRLQLAPLLNANSNLVVKLAPLIQQLLTDTNAPTPTVVPGGDTGPIRVYTKEERDKLPPGTRYVDPSGNIAIKK